MEDFVKQIKKILEIKGDIPKEFKLNQVDSRVTKESILNAYSFVRPKFTSYIPLSGVADLISMCDTTQEELEKERVERARIPDADATSGGRRSRYRRRPTKKYFKSRRHSSPKRKRHMKTKRHMKRHMKTKRY